MSAISVLQNTTDPAPIIAILCRLITRPPAFRRRPTPQAQPIATRSL